MPLFLMGCFPLDFQEVKRPLRTKSGKRPIKVGKRPIKEGKRPIKAMVLVGSSVGCIMGCYAAPPPWRKTAPLKRPITDLFSRRIFGKEFPSRTLWRAIHPGTAPLQALHCALCSTEQSTFRGGKNGENVPRKGEEEGWPAKGAKRKKDA